MNSIVFHWQTVNSAVGAENAFVHTCVKPLFVRLLAGIFLLSIYLYLFAVTRVSETCSKYLLYHVITVKLMNKNYGSIKICD